MDGVTISGIAARYWEKGDNGDVLCTLCPRQCRIAPGKSGFCRVRKNESGVLRSLNAGFPASLAVDPIEKKPLYHFHPGSSIFSIGTFGCNLGCCFCQNDILSRNSGTGRGLREFSPESLVALAEKHRCRSVALTYNEPTVFFEYGVEILKCAKARGLDTVLVTNGYIMPEPRKELYQYTDAANIDLKGFGDFYRTMCQGGIAPVLESCEYLKNTLHRHLEVTNLVIPGRNDSPEQIAALLDFVGERLGKDTPLHFSAYHPAGGYDASPPTPPELLYRLKAAAEERGLTRVHLGNIRL